MTSPPPDARPTAEDLFADYLEQVEGGAVVDFAAFCRTHPGEADALARIHARWSAISHAFTALSQAGSGPPVDARSASVEDLLVRLRAGTGRAQRYALGPEIARGAMGRVLSAWDGELRREVALKVHRDRDGDTRLRRRFLEEAQITGQLDHPGIVPIHELGLDDEGRPFFAMRLVRGSDLGEVLTHERAGTEGWTRTRVLHVLLRVCEAMAYAHSKGVVHRDLKPGNVMVGRFGEVYVMDWGLARVLADGDAAHDLDAPEPGVASLRGTIAQEDGSSPLLTQHGDVVGTPAYMAPELAGGKVTAIAPTADVYSVGAILHHLCVGHMPYAAPGEHITAADVLDRVRAGPPEPLPADIPVELRAIHDRATARDPNTRYAGMVELADDLRAYLELRVVQAYATGRWAELRKWLARNRALSVAVAAAIVALVVGVVVSTRLWVAAEQSAQRLNVELDASEFKNARLSLDLDDAGSAEDLLWRQHFAGRMPRASAWALAELHARSPCLATVPSPTGGGNPIAIVPDTGAVLVGGDDGLVRVLGSVDLVQQRVLGVAGPGVHAVAFVPAGAVVLVGTADGALSGIEYSTGRVIRRVTAQGNVRAIEVGTDGAGFATAGRDGRVLLWSEVGAEPVELATHPGARVVSLAFDRDGRWLASGADDGSVCVVALAGRTVRRLQLGRQHAMALLFPPGSDELWVGSATHNIFVVNVSSLAIKRTIPTRNGTCRDLDIDLDGGVLAGGWWRVDRFEPGSEKGVPVTLRGIWQFEVDAARSRLVTSLRDRGLSVIDRAGLALRRLPGYHVALAGDGRSVALGLEDRVVVRSLDGPAAGPDAEGSDRVAPFGGVVALDHVGQRLAVCPWGQARVEVFDVGTRRALFSLDGPKDAPFNESIAFRGDGGELAVVAGLTLVRRVDATTGAVLGEHTFGAGQVLRLRYSADNRTLVAILRDSKTVHLLSLATGETAEVTFQEQPIDTSLAAVAVSHDGRAIAVGDWQGVVRTVDLETGERREIRAHGGTTFSLEFAPQDRRLLISSGGVNGVIFWDLDTGAACHGLLRDEAPVTEVQLSADGRTLIARTVSGVVAIDLEYHERHVAGNLGHQLARLRDSMTVPPEREAELKAWAERVLARPWPRWRR